MSAFGETNGVESSSSKSHLFGDVSKLTSTEDTTDPWSLPLPKTSQAERVSRLLTGSDIPVIYTRAFNDARDSNPSHHGGVTVNALRAVLASGNITPSTEDTIIRSLFSTSSVKSSTIVDQGTWNVAMALLGLSQSGDPDLNLDSVDYIRNDLPSVKLKGYEAVAKTSSLNAALISPIPSVNSTANESLIATAASSSSSASISSTPWPEHNGNNDHYVAPRPINPITPSILTTSPPSAIDSGSGLTSGVLSANLESEGVWTSSSMDPSLYNPLSKDTIRVSVVPEKEGVFMFRHIIYALEGTIPSLSDSAPATNPFKVIRRYSDFAW